MILYFNRVRFCKRYRPCVCVCVVIFIPSWWNPNLTKKLPWRVWIRWRNVSRLNAEWHFFYLLSGDEWSFNSCLVFARGCFCKTNVRQAALKKRLRYEVFSPKKQFYRKPRIRYLLLKNYNYERSLYVLRLLCFYDFMLNNNYRIFGTRIRIDKTRAFPFSLKSPLHSSTIL